MKWRRVLPLLMLLAAAAAGKGKKHRHQKPGRDVLDRLASTTIDEVAVTGGAVSGLLPAPLDVAPYAAVAANATCGDAGTEEYCRDTPGKRGVVCDVCEGEAGPLSRRHPPAHAVDGDPDTWWQSPTLAAGDEYRHVALVAALPDEMELLHVIIKSGPSPRPLAWSLEVSPTSDGEDWRMIKAFGDRDHCRKLWDLRPERRRRKARGVKRTNRADKPACSTQFASPKPLENGEMHVGVGPGVWARRVRVSLRAPHAAPRVRQYYSVRALTLAARCRCHGHAQRCALDAQGATCECQHGTCGAHCQRCCGRGAWSPVQPCHPEEGEGAEEPTHGACSVDEAGDILCINCTDNRAGPLCDICLDGFYSSESDGPCLPCNCDLTGSDGTCKLDKIKRVVLCNCNPGFTGPQCDSCEDPSAVYPACLQPQTTPACKCDPRGVVDPSRVCDEVCECKENVVGSRCDACAPGHYGLSAALAAGCRRCYCGRLPASCEPDPAPGENMVLPLGDAWLVTDAALNDTLEASVDSQGNPYLINYEVEDWESFYWVSSWLGGEQLALYGAELRARVAWGVVRGDSGGNPTLGPDAILVAADGTMLAYGNRSYETPGETELVVPLEEGGWYEWGLGSGSGPGPGMVSRMQLMDTLADVRGVMLRAHFHFDQDEVRLEGVRVVGAAPLVREVCACPASHGGRACTRCAWGYVRLPRAPRASPAPLQCVPCACNGHAPCETVEGACGACQHNTTGAHCERCLPGHYGNPVQGACKPCACPLHEPSNNFSPNCALAAAAGDEYVCTQCPDGYAGDHCEVCDFGYWGSPTTPGARCAPCACGGAPCRRDTGACLACPAHAEGAACDVCEEGYWFGPAAPQPQPQPQPQQASCVPCACGAGALAAACDARSGQCACRRGWAGRACDTCAPGHGGVEAGCPLCRCGVGAGVGAGVVEGVGAGVGVGAAQCDPASGACACAPGAAPPLCDTCLQDHYGLSAAGCQRCNCSTVGAESNTCDIRTGQCRCKPHVTGIACDTCQEGYWGLHLGGCRRCACGAGAAACDPRSGACACAPGVGGERCDACLPAFYGFGPAGCLPCPVCAEGRVCSPESGRCVCPAHARGPGCRACARGYWAPPAPGANPGRAAPLRCRPCACAAGALSNTCSPLTGQCACRAGWAGERCERCAPGHFGARCRPCGCAAAGTRRCGDALCGCDERGRCPCKENVVGDKCSECRAGTFGLSEHSAAGCTACFCFGRSARCSEAGLARAALRQAADMRLRLAQGTTLTDMDQDSLLAIHTRSQDASITLPWPPVPVYVELEQQFLGDRTASYGGWLRYHAQVDGGEELPPETKDQFPLVRLYARDIVLDYYEPVPTMNGSFAVRLHESLWRVRGSGVGAGAGAGVASRGALMVALWRLERVLVRLAARAPRADTVRARLYNVSLDTAVAGSDRSELAAGVERCECPAAYRGASCQRPAPGYWLPAPRVHPHPQHGANGGAGPVLVRLEGGALPCRCGGRAAECHPDTGHCFNCTGGTGGAQCERCAAGHYGAPDAPGGCQPCPCPERARNFAAACSFNAATNTVQCLCKPGYAGAECSECAAGWRREAGGARACVPCGCSARGALGPACDARGRCRCRAGAAGARCDRCSADRTYMDNGICTACDNCTQTLLDSIEAITSDMHSRADITELSRIPKPFPVLREYAHNATAFYHSLQEVKRDLAQTEFLNNALQVLEEQEHKIFTTTHELKTVAKDRQKEGLYLSSESTRGLEEALAQRRRLEAQIEELNEFAQGAKHLSAHRALREARLLLRSIKDVRLDDYALAVTDVANSAGVQAAAVRGRTQRASASLGRARALRAALDAWGARADELARLADGVWAAGDRVSATALAVRPRLAALRDQALRCRLVMEDITSLSARNLSEQAGGAAAAARSLAAALAPLGAQLAPLARAAAEREGIYHNLTPAYRQQYLRAAEAHVHRLNDKALQFKRLLSGARAVSAGGVSAARGWADAAAAVREAARTAAAAAGTAALASKLAGGPAQLRATAEQAAQRSRHLADRGAAVRAAAEEVQTSLEQLSRGLDGVRVAVRGVGWRERELSPGGGAQLAAARGALAAAGAHAERVFSTSRALYDEAGGLRARARYQLRRRLADLQRGADTALGAAQEHVSSIRGNTERAAEVAAALGAAAAARAQGRLGAAAALGPRRAELRDQLERARHAAGAISVSLTSAPGAAGCARAYALGGGGGGGGVGGGGAATRAALALSFEGAVRDGPLLRIEGDAQESKRYMQLSVVGRRMRLKWDLGAGEGALAHPHELQPTLDDADHTSYRVEVERVWNTARLTLERIGGGDRAGAVTVSNSSGVGGVLLRPARLWLGGGGDVPDVGVGVGGGGLRACVHELRADGERLGLWNFAEQPRGAQCTGCTQRRVGEGAGGGGGSGAAPLAWFPGGGYAQLRRAGLRPYDARYFSVAFTVRTRDPDALLFMAVDAANNRSVVVRMRACRVEFSVRYGGGARLRIAAAGRHCAGRAVRVQAIRVFDANRLEKGSLRVNGEETLGSPTPPVQVRAALPDLAAARYWVGGLPPGADGGGGGGGGGWGEGAPPPALRGCLGALSVDRQGYDVLDTAARHRVEPGCPAAETIRSAIMDGTGHIELPAPALRGKWALGVSFRTERAGPGPGPDGAAAGAGAGSVVLLLRAPAPPGNEVDDGDDDEADDKRYLLLELVEGELQLRAAAARDELRVRTNGTKYDDGDVHAVRIVRAHRQLELWVDERRVGGGALGGGAFPARGGGLFLGGAPPSPLGAARSFRGTLADLIVNATVVGLEGALAASGAQLGRAQRPARPASPAPPRDAPAPAAPAASTGARCAKSASFTVEGGAVKFGDAAHSHASLRLEPGRAGRGGGGGGGRTLNATLQFRTYRRDGLLLLAPGSKTKPKHYLALMVREGRLRLVVRGRRRREVALEGGVADGLWRTVSLWAGGGRATLSSGGAAGSAHAHAARSARLYVGGLPAPPALPHLPPAIRRVGGLVGCVRRVVVQGRARDLVRDAAAHHRVGQCFPAVERGAYFGGDAYATWSSSWRAGGGGGGGGGGAGGGDGEGAEPQFALELQFRTNEPSGVLLAAGPLLLELRDGALVLTYQQPGEGEGEGEGEGAAARGGAALCDGAWHAARVRGGAGARGLELRLDGGPALRALPPPPPPPPDAPAPTAPRPLYIGGLPESLTESADGAAGRENFKGCIRDVIVDGRARDWLDMEARHNVLLDSCPAP